MNVLALLLWTFHGLTDVSRGVDPAQQTLDLDTTGAPLPVLLQRAIQTYVDDIRFVHATHAGVEAEYCRYIMSSSLLDARGDRNPPFLIKDAANTLQKVYELYMTILILWWTRSG